MLNGNQKRPTIYKSQVCLLNEQNCSSKPSIYEINKNYLPLN